MDEQKYSIADDLPECSSENGNQPAENEFRPKKFWLKPLVFFLIAALLLLGLTPLIRMHVQKVGAEPSKPDVLGPAGSLDEEAAYEREKLNLIYQQIKDNYFEELSDAELLRAMYTGMMKELGSPYTFYLSTEDNEAMNESMSGEYSGIGAQVSMQNDTYLISDIFDGSPAAEAGLHIGDIFVSVDGVDVSEFEDVSMLATKVRGEDGSTVELVMYRPSEEKELTFSVTRGKIENANLHYEMIEDGIGYIRIVEFNSGVSDNFFKAVDDLRSQGAETLIFDLRNNGGGYVYEVSRMLDYLLPKGVIATAKGRYEGEDFEENWMSEHEAEVPGEWRYNILINEFSASASELFSGCLRDYDKATLIGVKSFGKGVGTITQELTDGSAIQITNFRYFLPGGECIQDIGLTPGIEVELPEELKGKPISQLDRNEDIQLLEALKQARILLQGAASPDEAAESR